MNPCFPLVVRFAVYVVMTSLVVLLSSLRTSTSDFHADLSTFPCYIFPSKSVHVAPLVSMSK